MRRRGATLPEMLVAFGLIAAFLTLTWRLWSGTRRQSRQIYRVAETVRHAARLSEVLGRDLGRLAPGSSLPEEPGKALTLTVIEGYRPDRPFPMARGEVHYRYDEDRGALTRNDRLLLSGSAGVDFRLEEGELVAELASGEDGVPGLEVRLPLPGAGDGWVRARQHRTGGTPVHSEG